MRYAETRVLRKGSVIKKAKFTMENNILHYEASEVPNNERIMAFRVKLLTEI